MTSPTFNIRYTNWLLNHPIIVIILSLLLFLGASFGLKNVYFDTNYRVFFSKTNPQLEAFDQIEKTYAQTDNLMLTVRPKQGDIFQRDVLTLIQELTEASWKLPYATRVDSLTNFQHTYAEEDNLFVVDLVDKTAKDLTDAQIQYIKDVSLNEPLLVSKTISKDGTTTGVNITVTLPRKNAEEVPIVAQAARTLVAKFSEKYPSIDIKPSGVVMMNNAFMESSQSDLATLVPLMWLTLIVCMLIFIRSISATIATIIIIFMSAICAVGFGGWLHYPLTPPSAGTPNIVLTLAIADSVHIILTVLKAMHMGMDKRSAIVESIRVNIQPVFLTSLTTVIGFLSLNFSDTPPFWHLGNMTAFGIVAAFFFSVFLLPVILSLLPMRVPARMDKQIKNVDKIADFIIAKRNALLVLGLIIVGVSGYFVTKIEANDEFVQYFDDSISFRPDTEFMMRNLTGIYTVEYSVPSMGSSGISNPEYLKHLEAFTHWLRSQPEVIHVYSITDIFKRLNKNLHQDDPSWYRIPDNKELAAQYLLLYEMSLPYGLDLNDRINIDKSASRITATIHDLSTNEMREFKHRTEQWLIDNTPAYMKAEATSPVIMFSFISQRNIEGMTVGNILSLILISLCIILALRSLKIGLFSLLPNLSPILLGYGIWGALVGQINMAVAICAAVSLGIIVDDTIHFLSKYHRGRKEKGLTGEEAIHYAFSTVGGALIITSLVLTLGFSVLMLSGFQINFVLGALTSLVIVCALFADFMLLPPLLMLIDKKKKG